MSMVFVFHAVAHRGRTMTRSFRASQRNFVIVSLIALQLICVACSDLEKPKYEPYYSGATPPRKQEFRWSNGKPPKSMDPARAVAPPETDLVRAVFEGLTELEAKELKEKPAAAESWTASDDFKTWTFKLREGAKWSNGTPVTAQDFVRSWKRLGELGDAVAHRDLLKNIVGFPIKKKDVAPPSVDLLPNADRAITPEASPTILPARPPSSDSNSNTNIETGPALPLFGVSAPDARTLQVHLIAPDKDFPKLVAHPLFRPVFDEAELGDKSPSSSVVTNGAFRIAGVESGGIDLERSETHWNRDAIKLEHVQLVFTENAEQALSAYKPGDIDAVTNADFEPLALKLLEPFEDFRR